MNWEQELIDGGILEPKNIPVELNGRIYIFRGYWDTELGAEVFTERQIKPIERKLKELGYDKSEY